MVVVNDGISVMQSALNLADEGHYVYLIERSPSIGSAMAQMEKTIAAATDDATKAALEAGCKQGRAAMAQMPNAPAECK